MSRQEAVSLVTTNERGSCVLCDEELRIRLSGVEKKLREVSERRRKTEGSPATIMAETGMLVLEKSRILEGLEVMDELGGQGRTLSEKELLEKRSQIEKRSWELRNALKEINENESRVIRDLALLGKEPSAWRDAGETLRAIRARKWAIMVEGWELTIQENFVLSGLETIEHFCAAA